MNRLVAFLGLLAGFACALVFACKSSHVDVDAGEVLEAGMRGGPVVGSNPGQPFGPCPAGSDCYGSNWQNERTLFLQQIALALDASAGVGSGIFLNEAGVLTLAVPYQPALDGGFPAASTGQFFVQLSIGPGAATITGDLHCSTATPGLCTLTAIQGVPVDGSGGAAGYVLTWVDGGWSPQPAAVANYGLDLAANPDGGSGQVLVGITGNDGGAPLPVHLQGFNVDGNQRVWGITIAAPPDAATAPGSIMMTPAPPNAAASTTEAGTPGSFVVELSEALSTGREPGFGFSYVDAGMGVMGPCDNGANSCLYLGPPALNTGTSQTAAMIVQPNGVTGVQSCGTMFFEIGACAGGAKQVVMALNEAAADVYIQGWQWAPSLLGGYHPLIYQETQSSDSPTMPFTQAAQSAYAGASTYTNGNDWTICGGNHATGGGTSGNVDQGSGYTVSGPNIVCNRTTSVDGVGELFLPNSSTIGCTAGDGRIQADTSGNLWGCDSSGSPYRLNSGVGSCDAAYSSMSGDVVASSAGGCNATAATCVGSLTGVSGGACSAGATINSYSPLNWVNTSSALLKYNGTSIADIGSNIAGQLGVLVPARFAQASTPSPQSAANVVYTDGAGNLASVGSGGANVEIAPEGSGTVDTQLFEQSVVHWVGNATIGSSTVTFTSEGLNTGNGHSLTASITCLGRVTSVSGAGTLNVNDTVATTAFCSAAGFGASSSVYNAPATTPVGSNSTLNTTSAFSCSCTKSGRVILPTLQMATGSGFTNTGNIDVTIVTSFVQN